MPDEDIITRGDLNKHCEYLHEPIAQNFTDVKGWLEKLDKRMWAVVIGIVFAGFVGVINIFVSIAVKGMSYNEIGSSSNNIERHNGMRKQSPAIRDDIDNAYSADTRQRD